MFNSDFGESIRFLAGLVRVNLGSPKLIAYIFQAIVLFLAIPLLYSKAEWSEWSAGECDKKCDGGMAMYTRTCSVDGGCDGADAAFKECNTHSCRKLTKKKKIKKNLIDDKIAL